MIKKSFIVNIYGEILQSIMQDIYKPTLHFGARTRGLRREWPTLPDIRPTDQIRLKGNYGDPDRIWTVMGISWMVDENNWRLFLQTDIGTEFMEELHRVPFDRENIIQVTRT